MLCAGEDEVACTQLPYASQPLHFRRLQQFQQETAWNSNESMYGVSNIFGLAGHDTEVDSDVRTMIISLGV